MICCSPGLVLKGFLPEIRVRLSGVHGGPLETSSEGSPTLDGKILQLVQLVLISVDSVHPRYDFCEGTPFCGRVKGHLYFLEFQKKWRTHFETTESRASSVNGRKIVGEVSGAAQGFVAYNSSGLRLLQPNTQSASLPGQFP